MSLSRMSVCRAHIPDPHPRILRPRDDLLAIGHEVECEAKTSDPNLTPSSRPKPQTSLIPVSKSVELISTGAQRERD
jgi:hypothetical protein